MEYSASRIVIVKIVSRKDMSKESVNILTNRIESVIRIHRNAEDITIGEVIGVLEIIKLDLFQETIEETEAETGI